MRRPSFETFDSFLAAGFPVGRVSGIRVRVHITMLLPLAYWLVVVATDRDPLNTGLKVALMLGALWVSVLLHELGHCAAARMIGGEAESILLWPLGGLAFVTGAERSPHDEFVVILFGPLVSLALALAFTAIYFLIPASVRDAADYYPVGLMGSVSAAGVAFCGSMAFLNWVMFVFNMAVPLFPMDCARLLRSAFSIRYNAERVTYNVCLLGLVFGGLMIGLTFSRAPAAGDYLDLNILMMMLGLFGILHCLREMKNIEFNYVYTEPLRGRKAFDIVLGRLRRGRRPKRARVVDVAEDRELFGSGGGGEQGAAFTELETLNADLEKAVASEDFVRAAEIRDRIKAYKTGSHKA